MKDCMYKNAFMLVLQTGLRAGEVGALSWDNVDFDNRKIYVRRTLLQAKCKERIKPIYMHALRHTFATRCIENGMQPKVLQKIMGHSISY